MCHNSGAYAVPFLAVHRFRILVVGKVSPCNAQPSLGQTDPTTNHREALGNPRSSMLLSRWTCRLRQRERPLTSTLHFILMITIVLLSMRVLDLNLVIPRASGERLHAIWICVTSSDAISGSVGESVEVILSMRVPVVVAFTKSDLAFPQTSGSDGGNCQYQDRATTKAYAQCEQLCRSLFRRAPMDVPAELVSVIPQYGGLINNLIVTTDRFIMNRRRTASTIA
ncbi:hypothetical protein BJV77DRAFT_607749 [Russula vinacea]|nr:hypothetical protein BJV77DRAFT_607749 [Russula vinacea]